MKSFLVFMMLLNGNVNVPKTPIASYSIIDSSKNLVNGINKGINSFVSGVYSWWNKIVE